MMADRVQRPLQDPIVEPPSDKRRRWWSASGVSKDKPLEAADDTGVGPVCRPKAEVLLLKEALDVVYVPA